MADVDISARNVSVGSNSNFHQGNNYHGSVTIHGTNAVSNVYYVPDLLSRYFTARHKELEKIDRIYHTSNYKSPTRCVLYGMPGLGKTQLALKYANLVVEKQEIPYVFWMSAASVDKVTSGFSELYDLVRLGGHAGVLPSEKCTLARAWLEDSGSETRRSWLLVLDNADKDIVRNLKEILPRSNGNGRILITTRTEHVARSLAFAFNEEHHHIFLEPFGVDNAVNLFLCAAGSSHDQVSSDELEAVQGIVKSIGSLPLAVNQAASYTKNSPSDFKRVLETYQSEQVGKILDLDDGMSLYEEKSPIAAFTPALSQLEQCPPGTKDLLRIMAFLDPESISIDILITGFSKIVDPEADANPSSGRVRWRKLKQKIGFHPESKPAKQTAEDTATDDLRHARELLRDSIGLPNALKYLQHSSLVTRKGGSGAKTLWIHDLVSLLLQKKLMNESERRRWLQHAIRITCNALHDIGSVRSSECWAEFETFVGHVDVLRRHAEAQGAESMELLSAAHRIAQYFYYLGRYNEAIALHEQVLCQQRHYLGADHEMTLTSMQDLASAFYILGRLEEAEKLQIQVLGAYERVSRPKHHNKIHNMDKLALTYLAKQQWKAAEKLQLQAFTIGQETLVPDSTLMLRITADLAYTYAKTGRLEEAEKLQLHALEMGQRVLPAGDPDLLWIMRRLATTYRGLKQWQKAEQLDLQALETEKRTMGTEHPQTLRCMHELACIYYASKRWEEAERLGIQTLELERRVFRTEHLDTTMSLNSLAFIYEVTGRLDEGYVLWKMLFEGIQTPWDLIIHIRKRLLLI